MPVSGYEFLNLLGMLKIVYALAAGKAGTCVVLREAHPQARRDRGDLVESRAVEAHTFLALLFARDRMRMVLYRDRVKDLGASVRLHRVQRCTMLNDNELGPLGIFTQMIFISLILVSPSMIEGNIFDDKALIVSDSAKSVPPSTRSLRSQAQP